MVLSCHSAATGALIVPQSAGRCGPVAPGCLVRAPSDGL